MKRPPQSFTAADVIRQQNLQLTLVKQMMQFRKGDNMSLMDSIDIQYVWKAIQESERSDEISYPNTPWSDRLFQARHSESERSDSEESRPQPDALTLRARS